ncbi:cytochrome P450 [Actinophytocola sp.]|uniref:cytochrome P450 n=1 Tax=Actinophytocola sp. TaxID=1872138 RepID=UPI003D6B1E24
MNLSTEVPPHVRDMTLITSYDEADEIFRSKQFLQGSHGESRPFFGHSLLLLDGVEHFKRRRLLSALFRKEALYHYETALLQPTIDQVLTEAAARSGPTGPVPVDLVQLSHRMLLQMTAGFVGLDGVDDDESSERFARYLGKLGEGLGAEWSTKDHNELIAEVMAVRDEFVADFYARSETRRRELVESYRRDEIGRAELPVDLVTLMLLHEDPEWSDDLIMTEATVFAVAGTQTTAMAVPHAVAHLDAWVREHPEDRNRRTDLDFLQAATYESLRLHLPGPAEIRVASDDVTLRSGRTVRRGEYVALMFAEANRDRKVFGPDADRFDPTRTMPAAIKPWALGFGGGVHTCIGRQLVTGLSRSVDELGTEERSTVGIAAQILRSLYRAGVELDADNPPRRRPDSYYDAFEAFPVSLTRLRPGQVAREG